MAVLVGDREPCCGCSETEKSRCAHKAIQCVGWTETPNEIRWSVCRHYLAMTKSALFLFADGGKFNRGPEEKASLNSDQTLRGCFCTARLLFASFFFEEGGRLQLYPGLESCRNCYAQRSESLFCPTDSFSRCCSDRKTAQLCPNLNLALNLL